MSDALEFIDQKPEEEPAPETGVPHLFNPRNYETGHVKELDGGFAGGKHYLARLRGANKLLVGVQQFKRASEADAAAVVWKERLVVEYDAAVLAMVSS